MLPITHILTDCILSIPVLLKEWLFWLAKEVRIAICLMHVVFYPPEISSALVSHWSGPVCKEESFHLGIPQHLPCWDYGLLGCNTSRLQLVTGADCLSDLQKLLSRIISPVSMLLLSFPWVRCVCVAASFFYLCMSILISIPWRQVMS